MNINNAQEMYGFLIGHGLAGLCPESQNLVSCMDFLSRMCSCESTQAKASKYHQCMQSYVGFASRAQNYSNRLLSSANDVRMSFYLNNQLIGSISR